MSTLEATQRTQSGRTRFRAGLLAVGAIIAIGAVVLIVALSDTNRGTNPHPAIGTQARPYVPPASAVPSAAPAGHFRDPATHRLTRVSTTAATTQSARSSRTTLQSILRSLTPTERQHVLGIVALNRSHQAAAFGTGPSASEPTDRQVKELDQLQSAAEGLGLHPGVFGNASNR
jgi:hypothetical protein